MKKIVFFLIRLLYIVPINDNENVGANLRLSVLFVALYLLLVVVTLSYPISCWLGFQMFTDFHSLLLVSIGFLLYKLIHRSAKNEIDDNLNETAYYFGRNNGLKKLLLMIIIYGLHFVLVRFSSSLFSCSD